MLASLQMSLEASASDAPNVVAPESSTLLDNCSDTTSHLITRSHVESGQSPRIKHAVLYSAALYGLRVFLTDCKSSASSSHPQPSDGDINGAMLAATAVAVTPPSGRSLAAVRMASGIWSAGRQYRNGDWWAAGFRCRCQNRYRCQSPDLPKPRRRRTNRGHGADCLRRRVFRKPTPSAAVRVGALIGVGMPGRRCLPLEVGKEFFEVLDALRCKGDGGYVVEVQD